MKKENQIIMFYRDYHTVNNVRNPTHVETNQRVPSRLPHDLNREANKFVNVFVDKGWVVDQPTQLPHHVGCARTVCPSEIKVLAMVGRGGSI